MGEDAEQFGALQGQTNNAATVEDDDGDLLGGDNFGGDNRATTVGDDMDDFESSFPAIDRQNEVSPLLLLHVAGQSAAGSGGQATRLKLPGS